MLTRLRLLGVVVSAVAIPVRGVPQVTGQRGDDAHVVIRQALRAVEGDSVIRVSARWKDRLSRDAGDRAATLGLGTVGWLTYQFPQAEQYYARLIAHAPDQFSAYARLDRAHSLDARGMFASAAAEYDSAMKDAHAANDAPARAEILTDLSHTRYQSGGALAGLATLDTARRLLSASDTATLAMYHGRRAGFLVQSRGPTAEAEALKCIDLGRRAHILRTQALCLSLLGIEFYQRGNVDSALALTRAAVAMEEEAHNRGARGDALVTVGRMLVQRGDYGEARQAIRAGVADLRAAGQTPSWALYTLGEISRTIHDNAAATQYASEAAGLFEASAELPGAMTAHYLQAELMRDRGDLTGARGLFQKHLVWAQGAKLRSDEADARLGLADVAERERDWPSAAREFDSVRAVTTRFRMAGWDDRLRYEYGLLALRRGDLAEAERDLTTYMRSLDSTQNVLRYRAHARLAEIYATRGDLPRAQQEISTAGGVLDAWRSTLKDQDLRVLAFQSTDDEDPDLGIPKVLAILATHGYADAALRLAERRRARALSDLLVRAAALRTGRIDGDAVPRLSSPVQTDPGAALDGKTALMEYVTGVRGAPTTLFVVTRARPVHAYLLPPADTLDAIVARLVALMEVGADARTPSRTLGAMLLDSALADLPRGITRLVIVPDGPLHRVPFDALRMRDGRYAVESYAVGIAPSAAVLASLRSRTTRRGGVAVNAGSSPARILAFGDVAFPSERQAQEWNTRGKSDEPDAYRSAFALTGGLPRLVGSATEVRAVARYGSNSEVRLRGDASEAYLKHAALDSFGVIHFATHAVVDDQSVARTALALAPGGNESGFVSPGDLGALHLDADLIVLSACRTAGGVTVTGEGVQGLTAPLLAAGARSVVATQWRIGDQSTIAFVNAFYAALARKLPVVQALRAAKLDAIKRGASPSQWAAFTVIGDPLVVVPLTPPTDRKWIAAMFVAVVVIVMAMIYFALVIRKRRSGELSSPLSVSARTHQE